MRMTMIAENGAHIEFIWPQTATPFFRIPRILLPIAGSTRVFNDQQVNELYRPPMDAVVFWHDTWADSAPSHAIYRQQDYQPGGRV